MSADASAKPRLSSYWILAFVLLLTAAVILSWSQQRLLDQDEVFVLQTDSVGSIARLIDVQLHAPISLDPLFYHLLGHASVSLFGATDFAIRLPSLFGYLLMQVCLFFIARTIAGDRAGLVAATIPALTATVFYGMQARPYGVLLGLAALMLLAWQRATRNGGGSRIVWLVTLALATALALNTHYFAILLLIPLCAAELFRIATARRIDWPVAAAIILGMGAELLTLPFQKSAGEFRKHYYNAGRIGLHAITQAYRALFINYTDYSMALQHIIMAVLVLLAVLLIVLLIARLRGPGIALPAAELVFLAVLAALPFFGFLLARFVTHSIEVRYVLSAILALSIFIAIAAQPLLRGSLFPATALLLLLAVTAAGIARTREEHARRSETLRQLYLPQATQDALAAHDPHQPIYIQNMGAFDELGRNVPDNVLRSRLALVYSADEEIALLHHDTVSLTAAHMTHFTPFTISRYEEMKRQPGEHLMILYHGGGWNWLDRALAQDHAQITPLGPALEGEAVSVRFAGEP